MITLDSTGGRFLCINNLELVHLIQNKIDENNFTFTLDINEKNRSEK